MGEILDELQRRARTALDIWDLPEQNPQLLKFRENAVFKVCLPDGRNAALRLHRPGYHSEKALLSELLWMDELRRNGLLVPQPIATPDGRLLVMLDRGVRAQYVDLIGWVGGAPIGASGKPLEHDAGRLGRIFHSLGASMAEMHAIADRWTPPVGFARSSWDVQGLLGEMPVWGRFWDCAGLATDDRAFLSELRQNLRPRLAAIAGDLDFGLIHADLVRENVLVMGDHISLIDFDDCGSGFRLFDIATTLLRNRAEPHYDLIEAALLEGYRSKRPLGEKAILQLPLFLLLRSLTYIGWIGSRPELPDAAERMSRYVREARHLAARLEET